MQSLPTRQFLAAKSLWIQFLDSRYAIPDEVSKHIPKSCFAVNWFLWFLTKLSKEPPGNFKFFKWRINIKDHVDTTHCLQIGTWMVHDYHFASWLRAKIHIYYLRFNLKISKNQAQKHYEDYENTKNKPGTNSMTIIIGCFWTQIPINLTIFGWSYCFRIRPSCKNFFFCSSGSVTLQVFTATSRPDPCNLALYTSPKFPWKINNM